MNIFLATAMTDVPVEVKLQHVENMNHLINELNTLSDINVYSGLTHPANINRKKFDLQESKTLYKWYEELISKSDIFLADITYSSIGVGIELQIASSLSKQIYLIYDTSVRNKENISRMIVGINTTAKLIGYRDIKNLSKELSAYF